MSTVLKGIVLILSLLLAAPVIAGNLKHETVKVDIEDATRLDITCEFTAGEIKMYPADMIQAAIADIGYNPRICDFTVDYEVKKNTGMLVMESITRKKFDVDSDDNRWDVTLSTKYPTSLKLEMGACDADIDLGGVQLENFNLAVGAASASIDFSEPNPTRMKEFEIDAGAASVELHSVGNANFELLKFSGGVGSFDLDLRGEYTGESRIELEIGLGSMDITLPKDIPIRVETEDDNWLSSVDFHSHNLEEIDDGIFESPGFDEADVRIILEIEVGLGSVDLYWRR